MESIKRAELFLLLFREETMKEAIEEFYPIFLSRKESSKLIFVENWVNEENQCDRKTKEIIFG